MTKFEAFLVGTGSFSATTFLEVVTNPSASDVHLIIDLLTKIAIAAVTIYGIIRGKNRLNDKA